MSHLAVLQNDPEVPLDLLEPLLPGARVYGAYESLPDLDEVDGLVIADGFLREIESAVRDSRKWTHQK